MKISLFNNQSLLEKERYIKQFVSDFPFITGMIIFEEYRITTMYSVSGDLIHCEASPHNDRGRAEAKVLLKGQVCVAIDCSGMAGVKEAITDKIMKLTGQLN